MGGSDWSAFVTFSKIKASHFLGVYGLECYKTQELYFELEMAKWNVGKNESKIPESICSKPCPMGQIKNFEVFNRCCKNLPELRE